MAEAQKRESGDRGSRSGELQVRKSGHLRNAEAERGELRARKSPQNGGTPLQASSARRGYLHWEGMLGTIGLRGVAVF